MCLEKAIWILVVLRCKHDQQKSEHQVGNNSVNALTSQTDHQIYPTWTLSLSAFRWSQTFTSFIQKRHQGSSRCQVGGGPAKWVYMDFRQ